MKSHSGGIFAVVIPQNSTLFGLDLFHYTHRENGEDVLLVYGKERCRFTSSVALCPVLPHSASSPPTLPTVACLFYSPIVIISSVLALCCVKYFC